MKLKRKIHELLRGVYGDFNTTLEHEYEIAIIENLVEGDNKGREEWITYNQVVLELKNNLKDQIRVKELQYRLTDKEDPNNVCIEIIGDLKERSPELERLYDKIRNFI